MTSIPIFPLNTVLYPGSQLPLKIFEQRYLEMTKACVRDGTPFGVCRIREGQEVGLPAVPEQIGCTALIAQWEMPHLGVFHLQTRGQHPFRILRQTTQSNGLIRADVEFLAKAVGEVSPESFALCRRVLEQIVEKVGADYFFPRLALTIHAGPVTAWRKCCRWKHRTNRGCWRCVTTVRGWSNCTPTCNRLPSRDRAGAGFREPAPVSRR